MYQSDNEQSKRVFYNHESTNNNNNIQNNDSVILMTSYVVTYDRYVRYVVLKSLKNKLFIITKKYQTSAVYHVRT